MRNTDLGHERKCVIKLTKNHMATAAIDYINFQAVWLLPLTARHTTDLHDRQATGHSQPAVHNPRSHSWPDQLIQAAHNARGKRQQGNREIDPLSDHQTARRRVTVWPICDVTTYMRLRSLNFFYSWNVLQKATHSSVTWCLCSQSWPQVPQIASDQDLRQFGRSGLDTPVHLWWQTKSTEVSVTCLCWTSDV